MVDLGEDSPLIFILLYSGVVYIRKVHVLKATSFKNAFNHLQNFEYLLSWSFVCDLPIQVVLMAIHL